MDMALLHAWIYFWMFIIKICWIHASLVTTHFFIDANKDNIGAGFHWITLEDNAIGSLELKSKGFSFYSVFKLLFCTPNIAGPSIHCAARCQTEPECRAYSVENDNLCTLYSTIVFRESPSPPVSKVQCNP